MKTKKDEEPEIEKEDEEKAEDSKEEETKDSEKEKKAEDSEEKEDSLGCKTQARIDSLESEKSKLQSKVESLKKELSEVRSDSFIDERIKARVALISEAKEKAGQDLVLDGLSEKEIKIKAIEAQRSDLKLDGKSNDYIDAAFELLTVKEEEIFKKDSSEKRTTVEKLAQERQMKAQSYHIKGNK